MNWKSIFERVIAGVILLAIIGAGYLVKLKIDKDKEDKEFKEMIDFERWKQNNGIK